MHLCTFAILFSRQITKRHRQESRCRPADSSAPPGSQQTAGQPTMHPATVLCSGLYYVKKALTRQNAKLSIQVPVIHNTFRKWLNSEEWYKKISCQYSKGLLYEIHDTSVTIAKSTIPRTKNTIFLTCWAPGFTGRTRRKKRKRPKYRYETGNLVLAAPSAGVIVESPFPIFLSAVSN